MGDLYISGLASNNMVNITTANADIISISGSGDSLLNLNITNSNTNPFKLDIKNSKDIVLNTTNTAFREIKLESGGNLSFPVTDNALAADESIYLSASNINNNSNLQLTSKKVYVNQTKGRNSFVISADEADINGNNISVQLLKDTLLTDINDDSYSVFGNSIKILSNNNVMLSDKLYAYNADFNVGGFSFYSSNNGVMSGDTININALNDISGFGKIYADKVNLTGSTIGSTSNIYVKANYGSFKSTAADKPANDILININSDDWFKNLKAYEFSVSGSGLSYLNGKLIDYSVYEMVKNMHTRNMQPIENINIDKVTGDDLIKGGRIQDTSELVTIEDNKTPKINSMTKKNKSIELK